MPRTALILTALLCSCVSSEPATDAALGAGPAAPPEVVAWRTAFDEVAVMIADVVHIEGPKGLVDHIATRPVAGHHVQNLETFPKGFLHTIVALEPGVSLEIQAALDQLQIAALRQLTILERPGDLPVTVSATGNVFYQRSGEAEAQRGPSLKLVGPIPR